MSLWHKCDEQTDFYQVSSYLLCLKNPKYFSYFVVLMSSMSRAAVQCVAVEVCRSVVSVNALLFKHDQARKEGASEGGRGRLA